MLTLRVRDVATAPAITVTPDASFKEVLDLLLRNEISALPVVDGDGALVGMISEADLIAKQAYGGLSRSTLHLVTGGFRGGVSRVGLRSRARTAGQMMTSPAETALLDDTVRDVARRMVDNKLKHLVVVDAARRVVGVVSRSDLLRMFDRPDGALVADVAAALAEAGHSLSVTAHDGVVTLDGTVPGPDDVARACRVAWREPGVVDVVCDVRVGEAAGPHDVGRSGPAPP